MSRTEQNKLHIVQIDEEVYSWLQCKVRNFGDSPNSVLRRIAGLNLEPPVYGECVPPKGTAEGDLFQKEEELNSKVVEGDRIPRPGQLNGKMLKIKWGLHDVRHALFHWEGTWYHMLRRFPGVLCDPNGYVRFNSEDEYYNCPGVTITERNNHTDVRAGISALRSYVRMT